MILGKLSLSHDYSFLERRLKNRLFMLKAGDNMKCPKCRRTMARAQYKGIWYWECRCGANVNKPVEQIEQDQKNDSASEQAVDQHTLNSIL